MIWRVRGASEEVGMLAEDKVAVVYGARSIGGAVAKAEGLRATVNVGAGALIDY